MDPDERHKNQSFNNFNTHQTWDESSLMEFQARIEQQFNQFSQPLQTNQPKVHPANNDPEWDPKSTLNNLSFLEQKIHQVRDLVHLITNRRNQSMNGQDEMLIQQQHLITADLTSIIVQLITTAGTLLPSRDSSINHLGQVNPLPGAASCSKTPPQNDHLEEHESKDEEEPEEEEHEHLPEGTYEILQLEKEEILAPHTHFCSICGKGFKRDANLRMHMRGHGDEYKTPAALAKPNNKSTSEPMLIKRYSCPYIGCKRNKDHKKFQPLKTILCVKNHYKRTHCEKSYTCSRCKAKKFSVIADLKTHEKHCGRDKWLCSCGTTFSRKDKLLGHISLFQGHTAAVSPDEAAAKGQNRVQEMNVTENMQEDHGTYFSPLNFDGNALGGFQEFPQPPFQDSENEFAFFASGSGTCDYSCKPGNHME